MERMTNAVDAHAGMLQSTLNECGIESQSQRVTKVKALQVQLNELNAKHAEEAAKLDAENKEAIKIIALSHDRQMDREFEGQKFVKQVVALEEELELIKKEQTAARQQKLLSLVLDEDITLSDGSVVTNHTSLASALSPIHSGVTSGTMLILLAARYGVLSVSAPCRRSSYQGLGL